MIQRVSHRYPYAFSLGPSRFATAFSLHSFTLRPIHEAQHLVKTDEAPALASYALLPILEAYFKGTGVRSKRLTSRSPDVLSPTSLSVFGTTSKIPDELTRLGKLAQTPEANSIKLSPTSAASIPQLREAIVELRAKATTYPTISGAATSTEESVLPALRWSWVRTS